MLWQLEKNYLNIFIFFWLFLFRNFWIQRYFLILSNHPRHFYKLLYLRLIVNWKAKEKEVRLRLDLAKVIVNSVIFIFTFLILIFYFIILFFHFLFFHFFIFLKIPTFFFLLHLFHVLFFKLSEFTHIFDSQLVMKDSVLFCSVLSCFFLICPVLFSFIIQSILPTCFLYSITLVTNIFFFFFSCFSLKKNINFIFLFYFFICHIAHWGCYWESYSQFIVSYSAPLHYYYNR